ncbi:hypothetical protein HPB48_022415 [Haemaphysalis longicornis]|uniref:Endonuclease/exonuclease/phosphatase domain-containing protein n=1 Tax=Haemaphysalis longicornis TaxID=44386 RepID=A0A9J6GA68_HAELO|nr:hypothetical protein HPB48_022415 [Haemaphysalis longicornis]
MCDVRCSRGVTSSGHQLWPPAAENPRARDRTASRHGSRHSRTPSRSQSRRSHRRASRSAIRGRAGNDQTPHDKVSWADTAAGRDRAKMTPCDRIPASNDLLAKKLSDMERQLRNLQSQLHQQQQQFIKPSSTTPTHAAAPMLQPTTPPVQQTPQQINRPTTPASSQDAPDLHPEMDVAQSDDDDDKTPAAPKKRARKSTKVSCDVQIERLEERLTAKIDNLAGTIHTLTTTTEQRFARLEEMMAALALNSPTTPIFKSKRSNPLRPHNAKTHPPYNKTGAALTIWQWNCRSYNNKKARLQQHIQHAAKRPDIIMLQETVTLDPTLPGYKTYADTTGGGAYVPSCEKA